MTDWPDDWFRDGAGGAGSRPGDGPGPGPRPGPAAPLADPAHADQLTQSGFSPGPYPPGASAPSPPGASARAYPGGQPGSAGRPAGGWPDQPALRTSGRPRGPAWAGGPGGPGSGLAGGPGGPGGPGFPGGPGGPGFPGGLRLGGWRRWLRPRPILAILAVLASVLLIGAVSTYFYLDSQLTRKNVLVDYAGRPAQGAGQNWLITGSDSRQGLTRAQIRRLATGYGIGGQRSDTIMVLHLPANGGRPVLVSLPRDSYVPIPGYGDNKINAAYSIGGPALLAKTVQNVTGLRIDHYMGIGFGGFVRVVDAVGGVSLCLKAPLVDPAAGLHLHAGCQVLNGAQALGFVRSRHLYATQDLQRIQNQRVFLRSLLRKLTSSGVMLNPFESYPAASNVAGSLTVDQGTSLYQLLQIAMALRNPITTTVPIGNSNYVTSNAGDALLWDRSAALKLFADLNTDQPLPKSLITGSTQAG